MTPEDARQLAKRWRIYSMPLPDHKETARALESLALQLEEITKNKDWYRLKAEEMMRRSHEHYQEQETGRIIWRDRFWEERQLREAVDKELEGLKGTLSRIDSIMFHLRRSGTHPLSEQADEHAYAIEMMIEAVTLSPTAQRVT